MGVTKPLGGNGGSRDSWCTPKWLADLIGTVALDPCSNDRSHVRARCQVVLDGLSHGCLEELGPGHFRHRGVFMKAESGWPVFINPPYSRGEVIRWVRHYAHTRFIYLLRWDPSTEWFGELIGKTTYVWFPNRRINFEPPPGVKSSSNPYPHALFIRGPEPGLLTRLSQQGYLLTC